jgi:hypothetical protein
LLTEGIAILAAVITILRMVQRKFHEPVEPDGAARKYFFANEGC